MNEVSDKENDNIEDVASLASDDKVNVAPSTSFNFDDPDEVNGADQNATGNDDNASNSTETTQRCQLTQNRLIHVLKSALNEQKYKRVSLSTTEKTYQLSEKTKASN